MAGKPIRLGRAAGELNVGVSTLVEFLESKGIKIENNPNSKVEGEYYDILQKEFAADQDMKELSKTSSIKREKRETISIRDSKQEEAPEQQEDFDDSDPINVEEIKRSVFEEPKKEEPVKEEPKIEEPKVETPKENSEAKTIGEGDVQVQVVGRIDLDKLNTKTRPDKKKTPYVAPAKPAVVAQVTPEKKPETPVVEEAKKDEEAPKEIETIRVERKVLSGPTVL